MRATDWKMMGRPLIGKMDKQTDIFETEYYSAKKKKKKRERKINCKIHRSTDESGK